ncbi:MAG: hypothetical protein WDO17_17685 [Alphaproteobacteria bacterium]
MTARAMLLGVLTAVAAATIAAPAAAYTYTVSNQSTFIVTQVWMHTVSNFCHDRTWNGALLPGQSMQMSTASICLVDRVEVNGKSGKISGRADWNSGFGLPAGTFYVRPQGPAIRVCWESDFLCR